MSPASPFDVDGATWQPVSAKLIPVRQIAAAIFLGIPFLASAVTAYFTHPTVWVAPAVLGVLLLWVLWLVPRQVRAIGYAELDDELLIRKGVLFRSLVVVPYGRMQYVDVDAGPIARSMGIAQVQLHTASAQSDASIPGLPEAEATRLRDQLSARGEAKLAGL
ncbi:PH domain-containing protein [Ruania halotolerans]|uniref:PH domain-containing protein n=1 Tax=Ruania halotolerans TaxID=2897773 RepID=UPI001E5F4FB0|nr:PH domain-containing protein [Ruania halotolerans]UFU07174.1 PH domain-containing protein [Ruania halotolerans]